METVKSLKTVIQIRRDTQANWLNSTLILKEGEPSFATDTGVFKLGDGIHTWSELPVNSDPALLKLFEEKINALEEMTGINADSGEESATLLDRIESIEKLITGSDDGTDTIDTVAELIAYVEEHGSEVTEITNDISELQELVGETSVAEQIEIASKTYEKIAYEIQHTPVGTLVDYRDKEIRVMCPADTKWVKQNVGATGNANMYYMSFKAYAPEGAVSFKEGDKGVIIDEMFDFNGDFAGTDEYGRNYSICWLALAVYDEATDTWTYYGKNSTANKFIGWTYVVNWYDKDGVVIGSDCIRINLSNEDCHSVIEPYYVNNIMKEIEEKITEVSEAAVIEVVEF